MNKLFIIHCGYYEELGGGKFEMHVNLPTVAQTIEEARVKIKLHTDFITKKMHIDGIQMLDQVGDYLIRCESIY